MSKCLKNKTKNKGEVVATGTIFQAAQASNGKDSHSGSK